MVVRATKDLGIPAADFSNEQYYLLTDFNSYVNLQILIYLDT